MAVASGAGGTGQARGARGSSASQSAAGPGAGADDDADRPFNDLQDIAADLLTQLRPMYVWGNHDMAPYAPWNNSEVGSSSAKARAHCEPFSHASPSRFRPGISRSDAKARAHCEPFSHASP